VGPCTARNQHPDQFERDINDRFRELEHYPKIFISAKTHQRAIPFSKPPARFFKPQIAHWYEELNKFMQEVIDRTTAAGNSG
jgi:predicted GTPase